ASATLRFQVLKYPLVVTPFAGFSTPTRHYNTLGHTALGSRLRTADVGVNLGRTLSPLVPNLFVQANYTYTLIESLHDVGSNSMSWGLEVGYFVTSSVSVRGYGSWLHTNGGIDLDHDIVTQSAFDDHD